MKKNVLFPMILLLSLVFPLPAKAQFSLKPSPLPTCKAFLLTEIGYYYRVSSFPEDLYPDYKHHSYFTSNIGLMMNLSSKFSIGAANFVGIDNGHEIRWGAKVRARRWFGPEKSADLSLGLNFADSRTYYDKPAFSGELSLNLRDQLIFNILVEVGSYNYELFETAYYDSYEQVSSIIKKGSDVGIYTGIKTGRNVGLIAHIAGALIGAAILGVYLLTVED
jgi:hypothetical protein